MSRQINSTTFFLLSSPTAVRHIFTFSESRPWQSLFDHRWTTAFATVPTSRDRGERHPAAVLLLEVQRFEEGICAISVGRLRRHDIVQRVTQATTESSAVFTTFPIIISGYVKWWVLRKNEKNANCCVVDDNYLDKHKPKTRKHAMKHANAVCSTNLEIILSWRNVNRLKFVIIESCPVISRKKLILLVNFWPS